MSLCKVCLKEQYLGLIDLLFDPPVCINCLRSMDSILKREIIDGIEYLFIYKYNDILKDVIFSFKGLYIKDLALVLTYQYKWYLKFKYRKHTFLCVPSTFGDDNKRGFNHVEEIAKTISSKVITPFYKVKEWKQSSKNKKEREDINNVIAVNENMISKLKRIVIIDDIYSTGNTIKSCIRQIKHKCDIKVLCICKNVSKNV